MPKLELPLADTPESVVRPVIFDITRQLSKVTGISEDTRIYFPGYIEKDRQPGSTVRDTEVTNTFGASPKITIDIDEVYDVEHILSSAVYRPENLFIFRDDRIFTSIKPAYATTEVTINYRYRTIDKIACLKWRDDIKNRISMMRDELLHTATYHYLIPKEFLVILEEIHRLRENVAGYGEDFDTFLKANLTQRASLISNLSGKHQEWGISEKQMRILGWFDFEGVPEQGSREDDDDSWTISFAYKFKYDKPVACVMQYPFVIHNQMLSSKYRPSEVPYQLEHHLRSYSLSAKNFGMFEKTRDIMAVSALPGVAVPEYDDFIPSSIVPDTLRVFTTLVTLDEQQPKLLFNLTEFGRKWELDEDIVEFLRAEAPYLSFAYKSIFGVQLYRNADLMPDGSLIVDSDLNVWSKDDLSLRDFYHVRLSIVKDLSMIPNSALDRSREFGPAMIKTLSAIDPSVEETLGFAKLLGGKYIGKQYLNSAIDVINRAILSDSDKQIRQFNTVMSLFIQASNKE